MENALDWFEIPVVDLPRAVRFYEAMLATTLEPTKLHGADLAVFRSRGVRKGALLATPRYKAPQNGTVVYLHVGRGSGSLDGALARARDFGGQLLVPVTDFKDVGWVAMVRDTEGNTIGLHAAR